MTAAEILIAIAAAAVKYGPAVVDAVEKVIADVKSQNPQLGDAPPADGEAKIDGAIDAEVAAKQPKAEAST